MSNDRVDVEAALIEALEPFARLAGPRHPIEEPNGPSAIDLLTDGGEYDEMEMRSYVGPCASMILLDAEDFRRARSALELSRLRKIEEGVLSSQPLDAEVEPLSVGVERAAKDALFYLRLAADQLEKLAFSMPPPNSWTPQFVMLANSIRHEWVVLSEQALRAATPTDQSARPQDGQDSLSVVAPTSAAKGGGALSMGRKLFDAWQAGVPPSGFSEPLVWDDYDAYQQTLWDKAAVRFACLIGPAPPPAPVLSQVGGGKGTSSVARGDVPQEGASDGLRKSEGGA